MDLDVRPTDERVTADDRRPRPRDRTRPTRTSRDRNVPWVVLGVLLVVGSGLAFGVWATSLDDRRPVVALARDVRAGEVLTADHLTTVGVAAERDVGEVPASGIPDLVGRVARTDLAAGALVHPSLLTEGSPLEAGEALVGVSLAGDELPLRSLRAGDAVLAVRVPDTDLPLDATAPADGTRYPAPVPATVFAVDGVADASGLEATLVSLRLDQIDAGAVAAAAARGDLRLVLVPDLDSLPAEVLAPDLVAPPVSAGATAEAP